MYPAAANPTRSASLRSIRSEGLGGTIDYCGTVATGKIWCAQLGKRMDNSQGDCGVYPGIFYDAIIVADICLAN